MNSGEGTASYRCVARRHEICPAAFMRLTAEANCQLQHSGISCSAGDAAERGRSEAPIRLAECRSVSNVEQFGTEFHSCFAKKGCVLDQGQVEIAVAVPRTGLQEAQPIVNWGAQLSSSRPDVMIERLHEEWS